jgi:phosphoribosyl-ATP pyrophosphohydrolase
MSDSLDRLYRAVMIAKDLDPATSRTARLFQRGPAKMAKKLAEEAIEVVIDAVNGKADAVVRESADLLYNLSVLWVAAGVRPQQVWDEMDRRERTQGIAEKLPKRTSGKLQPVAASKVVAKIKPAESRAAARRPIVALNTGRMKKRR